jgi:predicted metalloprotease with PDZ domain
MESSLRLSSLPRCSAAAALALLSALTSGLPAQTYPTTTPAITIAVDASDAAHRFFHAKEILPARPGAMTFYYPKWIPGEHGPGGPLVNFTGLKFFAAGKEIPWVRDSLDMFTFRVSVPAGVNSLEVHMDYVAPVDLSTTDQLCVVDWNQLLVYPKGFTSDQLTYQASIKIPAGWKFGTSLAIQNQAAQEISFAATSLTLLVDSPVLTGSHFRVVPLAAGVKPVHEMDIAADSEAALQMPDEEKAHYDNLVNEAYALFGSRHFRDYHFLLSASDHVAHYGLEHHESNDSRIVERGLLDESPRVASAFLLPHEYVHSWNGKYRRPDGLATPDYEVPMTGDLLWVYEGLTEYYGFVLAARSQLWTPEQFRGMYAAIAAVHTHRPGRSWRDLEDTAVGVQLWGSAGWSSWRRGTDYYDEGALIWLEVDTIIRQRSGGTKSLDDFCKIFYGGGDTPPAVKTYAMNDVVATLNQVQPYDWQAFLNTRIYKVAPEAPLGGITNGGWQLVYTDKESDLERMVNEHYKASSARDSIGLILDENATVVDSIIGMAAYNAGIVPGMKVVAVNSRKFSWQIFLEALKATKTGWPLELLVENVEFYKTVRIDYHDGERYPQLVRDSAKPDLLADIIKPQTAQPATAKKDEKPTP